MIQREIMRSKDGKYGMSFKNSKEAHLFVRWWTKEEFEKMLAMYDWTDDTYRALRDEVVYQTKKEILKETLPFKFKQVFYTINKNWNYNWISKQSNVDRTCIYKMMIRKHILSVANVANLILFIYRYIPNFCLWYLFANNAPFKYDTKQSPEINKFVDKYDLKKNFSTRLINVFNEINIYWISAQAKIERIMLQKILENHHIPALATFIRLLVLFNKHIENFNIWYLLIPDQPMKRDEEEYVEDYFQYTRL